MTTSLEKVFFNHILANKKYFDIVMPYFFRNSEIQFVYGVVKEYITSNFDANIPTARQMWEMVSLEDKSDIITKEILKSILTVNLNEYDEKNFIDPKFNAWILSNRLRAGAVDIVDETRNLDNMSGFDQILESANKIKSIIDDVSSTSFLSDDNMGSDFDDAENHIQDSSRFKVKSGFETLDHMLNGGWDQGSLNILMAETSNGKCFSGLIRVSEGFGKSRLIEIKDLFKEIKNKQRGETRTDI